MPYSDRRFRLYDSGASLSDDSPAQDRSCGADEVIHPERDVALRAARKYSARNVFDFFELADDFSVFEISPPDSWIGKNIKQISVRSKYNINIIAIKQNGKIMPVTSAEYIFKRNEHLIIAGNTKDGSRLLGMK